MKLTKKITLKHVILFMGLSLVVLGLFVRHYYLNATTSAKLTTFVGVLEMYAHNHSGWYPNGGATSLASLQKLHPLCDAEALAGMSGNGKKTVKAVKAGKLIDETMSSWTSFPGFRNDDPPNVAILWERKAGVFINGSSSDGHAVGFVGAMIRFPAKIGRRF